MKSIVVYLPTYTAPSAPPDNINVTAVSPTELLVEWDPINCQDQNGEVILYELFYQTFTTFDEQLDVLNFTLNTTNQSAVLDGLEEYVEYEVIVRGYTSEGPGPYSTQTNETTLQSGKSLICVLAFFVEC